MVVTTTLFIGAFIVGAGVLLQIVGMATTQWMKEETFLEDIQFGLFDWCGNDNCHHLTDLKSQDKAVQALAILGVVAGGVGLIMATVFLALIRAGKNPIGLLRIAAGLQCMVAGGFIFLCATVYGAKIYKDRKDNFHDVSLGYSFGLSIGGGCLLLLGGCLITARSTSPYERLLS